MTEVALTGRLLVATPLLVDPNFDRTVVLVLDHDGDGTLGVVVNRPTAVPVREVLPWAVFIGLILLIAIYFVGAEQGATSIFSGMYVHEFVHDGRHLLGFPCH